MRLVIATPLYPPEIGGPATYTKLLEEGLPSKGIEVEVVKFSEVRHLPKIIRHYAYYRRVLAAARGADVVLALDPVSVGLPAMKATQKARKPFVVKVVGDYAWEQGQQRFGVTQNLDDFVRTPDVPFSVRMLRRIQMRVARSATRVIVPSEYLKGIVATWGISQEKMEVIYNAVEVSVISTPPKERAPGFFIVSSGRRVPWKGFEALKHVVARETDWHLRIASGLPRAEALEYVQSADVFVLNSDYEGFSHALIEVMMLGTPIIATNVGGNTELIEDGTTGLLIPPKDDEALYNALKRVQEDPVAARERAETARVFVQKFSRERMLARTSDVLKSL